MVEWKAYAVDAVDESLANEHRCGMTMDDMEIPQKMQIMFLSNPMDVHKFPGGWIWICQVSGLMR